MAGRSKSAEPVEVELLTDASGEGWAAAKGVYRCSARRAKMLIKRGYARPIAG